MVKAMHALNNTCDTLEHLASDALLMEREYLMATFRDASNIEDGSPRFAQNRLKTCMADPVRHFKKIAV